MPNNPNLKQWNYDTSTNIFHDFKYDGMDPLERPTIIHFNKINYMTPQFEKVCCILIKQSFTYCKNKTMTLNSQYWSKPAKPMKMPPSEYNDKYKQPKLMSNIHSMQVSCVRYLKLKIYR